MSNKKANAIKFGLFIAIISISVVSLIINRHNINFHDIAIFIRNQGAMAVVIYLLFYALKPVLLIVPTNALAILGGTIFGPVKGTLITSIGFWISGTIAFYLSRFLGKDFVQGILGKKMIKAEANIEKDGFRIITMLRMIPVLPYDPFSYACGFTKIKYRTFIIASVIGVLPETICYSVLGKNFKNPLSVQFLLPIGILLVGVIVSKPLMNHFNKKKEKSCSEK